MKMRQGAWLLILFTNGLLGGCATFQSKPLLPEKIEEAFLSRRLDDAGLRTFIEQNSPQAKITWPVVNWDLQALMMASLYFHPDLDVVRAQWMSTKAGMITAGERPNPSFGVSPTFNSSVKDPTPWALGFNLDVPIETAGKRNIRVKEATHLSEAARLSIANTAWHVRSRLRAKFLDLYGATGSKNLLSQQISLQEPNMELIKRRESAGLISPFDASQTRILFDQTFISLQDAERQKASALAQLADAIGVSQKALEGMAYSFEAFDILPSTDSINIAQLQNQALITRPDLLAILQEYEAAQSTLQLEIRKQYPDIHLGPGYTYDQGQNKWTLGFSFTLPLFNRNHGAIEQAKAHREEVAARFVGLQASIIGAINDAYVNYVAAWQKWGATQNLVLTQVKRRNSVDSLKGEGETLRLARLNLDLEEGVTKSSLLDAKVKAQQALGALEDAIQRPIADAIKIPNEESNPRGDK